MAGKSLVNAFTITRRPPKREPCPEKQRTPLRFCPASTTLMPMPDATIPQIPAAELAHRLDRGERVQLLDIRASERVAQGTVSFGPTLDFRALPASEIYRLPWLAPLELDPANPVAGPGGTGTPPAPAGPRALSGARRAARPRRQGRAQLRARERRRGRDHRSGAPPRALLRAAPVLGRH